MRKLKEEIIADWTETPFTVLVPRNDIGIIDDWCVDNEIKFLFTGRLTRTEGPKTLSPFNIRRYYSGYQDDSWHELQFFKKSDKLIYLLKWS